MPKIETFIIPTHQQFAKVKAPHELDKKAICIFTATGFFLDTDTYYKDLVALPPASTHTFDASGNYLKSTPWFQWHYTPRTISFDQALAEFTTLFEQIIEEQVQDKKVILPLSGGLDSRTQAVALKHLHKDVQSYSYDFKGGYPETKIAGQLAAACDFDFKALQIEKGYLWDSIEALAKINQCYSEFTHPRQMAIVEEFEAMGAIFSLGHWGDVLFDKGAPEGTKMEALPDLIVKKVIKKGGLELATALWQQWELEGDFETYFRSNIQTLLDAIKIDNVSAKMRAFKSLYWAPRWTSTNLAVFASKRPVTLPYYDDRMCQFICTLPEAYLADRKLQIAYIKSQNPKAAKVTWQDKKPYNLYTYEDKTPLQNIPYRLVKKVQRELKSLFGNPLIQRNWELQFVGTTNEQQLESYLFSEELANLVDPSITKEVYTNFKKKDAGFYSHPVSMLLTLALKMKQGDE